MPITKTYTFFVSGTGLFPFDMLRYDRCTPAKENDSAAIERTTYRHGRKTQVMLTGPREPTRERWASFGWEVGELNVSSSR